MQHKRGLTTPLIRTKLYRPVVPEGFVSRPRLLERLNQAATRPFTLLSAPAGFGKSTLLSAWLREWKGLAAWLSLDQNDNELSLFLAYFLAAIHTFAPDVGATTQALLDGSLLPPTAVLAANLINDLDTITEDFVLVLDDYNVISNRDIHDLIASLLHRPPRSMHLVMATRHDPLLPRVSLLAQGRMAEIRAPELSLTLAETAVYLQQALPGKLDPATIATLHEKTEGWITGLRLAVLSLRHQTEVDNIAARLQASNRMTMDYLVAEVLAQQPADFQIALLQTAVLDRFNSALCTAVCWPSATSGLIDPGWQFLAWLEETDLFIIPLDEQQEWYRYHHLFQDLLQHQLRRRYSPEDIAALHGRASQWFIQHDLPVEAIQHALAAGDTHLAIQIVAQRRHHMMNREQWPQLNHWLRLFPVALVDDEPELLLLRAWILYSQWRYADLPPLLNRLESLLADALESTAVRLRGELEALRSQQCYWMAAAAQSLEHAQHALTQLPPEHAYARGVAWVFLAGSRHLMGDTQEAIAMAHQALAEEQGLHEALAARLLPALAFLYLATADLPNLIITANRLRWLAEDRELVESTGWAHYFLGAAAYYQNNLAAAENHFLAVTRHRYIMHSHPYAQSSFGLALTYQAQGRPADASTVAAEVVAFMAEMKNAAQLFKAQSFQVHLALLQGNTAVAIPWIAQAAPHLQLTPMLEFYVPHMTLGRALLALEQWADADEYISRMQPFLQATCNTRFLVEMLVQRAWLFQAHGEPEAALAALKKAMTLAAPGRIIRSFADYSSALYPLFAQLAQQRFMPEYLSHIQTASLALGDRASDFGMKPSPQSPFIEPLTYREMDVLLLMDKRLTNKEIAQELCISVVTVKQHAYNLYQKLGVHGRRQAVIQAHKLGIMT